MLVTLLVKFRNKDCKTTELGLLLQVLPVRIVTFVETLGSHLKLCLQSSSQSLDLKISQTVDFIRKALFHNIETRQNKAQSVKWERRIYDKNCQTLWRISTKIMQQAEQHALNKFSTRKRGISGYTTQN